MKKIFTLLFCAVMFCTVNAQGLYQMEDPGFEGTWERDDEPIGWSSFSTANANDLSSYLRETAKSNSPKPSKVSGYYSNSAVQIYSKYVGVNLGFLGSIGANANGNITTGIINMGSTTPANEKNYNYTATTNDEFNMPFAGRPDAVVFYAKFTSGGSPNGLATFILHDEVNYRDPEISSQAANRVGKAQVFIPATSDWTYYKAEFAYDRETPAKQYLLANVTTNPTPGGSKDDYLVFDDVYFLYYSTLSAISYEGVNVNFNEDTYYYDLSSVEYSADKFSYTKKGVGATVSESFDEELQKMTITVRGNDYSVDSSNETVYTVQFKKEEAAPVYTAVASSNNALFGNAKVVDGGNNVFTFTATAAEGYEFVNWTSNGVVVSTENPYTVTATADLNLVANFVALPPVYTATVSSNNAQFGSANVEKSGDNIFTFTATAAEGYEFVNWTSNGEEVSVDNPYTVTATEDINLVANFVALPPVYTATVSSNNAQFGSANVEKNGDNVFTFTATAAEGYKFVNWTLSNGKIVSTENPYTLTASANVELVANFVALPPVYTATVSSNNELYGSAKVVAGGDNLFTFTATPNNGYIFASWTSDGKLVSADNPYTVTATDNLNLVANFVAPVAPPSYTVTAEAQDATMGTATVEVVDGVAYFKAVPNEGYKFVDWLFGGEATGQAAEFSFPVEMNMELVAVFEAIEEVGGPNFADGVYEIKNADASGSRGYFVYSTEYPTTAQLAGVELSGYESKHYAYGDPKTNSYWYLYTVESTGARYLFNVAEGHFLSKGDFLTNDDSGQSFYASFLSKEIAVPVTIEESTHRAGYYNLKVNGTHYLASSCGWAQDATPVRLSSGQADGGNPLELIPAADVTVDAAVMAAVKAVIDPTAVEPEPEEPAVKWYRLKETSRNEYMNVVSYDPSYEQSAYGMVNIAPYAESNNQIFTMEDAGDGKVYLRTNNNYYLTCGAWNVNVSPDAKEALIFEETTIDGATAYFIHASSQASNGFKIGGVNLGNGTYSDDYYVYCDAPQNLWAYWVLEEATLVEETPVAPSYTVTAEAQDATMGTATVEYVDGKATFTATPNEGYKFVDWSWDGTLIGQTSTFVVDPVEFDIALVAIFEAFAPAEKEYLAFVSATPENNSTVGSLSYVILAFDPDTYVYEQITSVDVKDAQGNVVTTATFGWMIPEVGACKGNELVLTLTAAISEAGTYTITLPEGAVWDYVNATEEITVTFTVDPSLLQTGIDGVIVKDAKAIYDATGRRIVEITRPGIYIVDGVKVLVK